MSQRHRIRNLGLGLFGGVLLFAAWPPLPFTALVFVGLLPFFWLAERRLHFRPDSSSLWMSLWPGLLLWNALTSWWLWHASPAGALLAIFANSALMMLPFGVYLIVGRQLGVIKGRFAFITAWLAYEFLHQQWELAWPWLQLGNVFASTPGVIQWYNTTGVLGGTLWVLLGSLLLYLVFLSVVVGGSRRWRQHGILALMVLFLPVAVSMVANRAASSEETLEVVVVQPNFDPYSEKFDEATYAAQVKTMISLSRAALTPATQMLIWPETCLPGYVEIDAERESDYVTMVMDFLAEHPQLTLIAGAVTLTVQEKQHSAVSRKWGNSWVEVCNSALALKSGAAVQHYHKSKLVPGVERMPYPGVLSFLERYAIDLGGSTGSYGTQQARTLLTGASFDAGVMVCYESVFGDFSAGFTRSGANVLTIITNDGWWGNTAGHKQHLLYARLRAIENGRAIARSANTGISAFIHHRGRIVERLGYWEAGSLRAELPLYEHITTYVRYGDVLGRSSVLISILLLLIGLASKWTNRFEFRLTR